MPFINLAKMSKRRRKFHDCILILNDLCCLSVLCLGAALCSKRHSRMKPHGCTGTVSAGSGSQNKSNKGWNLGTEPGFTTVTCRPNLLLMTYI